MRKYYKLFNFFSRKNNKITTIKKMQCVEEQKQFDLAQDTKEDGKQETEKDDSTDDSTDDLDEIGGKGHKLLKLHEHLVALYKFSAFQNDICVKMQKIKDEYQLDNNIKYIRDSYNVQTELIAEMLKIVSRFTELVKEEFKSAREAV